MSQPDLDHLRDHVDLYTAALVARLGTSEDPQVVRALEQFHAITERIAQREAANPELIAPVTLTRLGLGETEQHVVWLLAALAMNPRVRNLLQQVTGEPTLDPSLAGIRSAIYGLTPAAGALDELGRTGTLRRLGIIERSDAGEVHETRWTWTLAARMLRVLHGDIATTDDEIAALSTSVVRRSLASIAVGE
jgi:hypothetical protein